MNYLWKRRLLHLFFPTRCPVCGELIGAQERFCSPCSGRLVRYSGSFSVRGAESFTAAFDYDENIKPAVYLLKNGTDGNASYALGSELADRLRNEGISADVIVPVPMRRRDLLRRGFNQTELIAREIGRELGIPVETKALTKERSTSAQKELSREERQLNLRGAFSCTSDVLKNKRVLLVDDICTTGSTLSELTEVIMKNGAASVSCACCCKTTASNA